MATTITEALAALLPTLSTVDEAHEPAFRRAAELLLNGATLRIAGAPHRLTEIEIYWTSAAHPDPFTHRDPLQRERGRWYFHRQGETYKGGTYKGLDVAVGGPELHAGVLLRGIACAAGGPRIEGSCAVVDRILALTGAPSVAALAGAFDRAIDPPAEGAAPLTLGLDAAPSAREVYASPRVGLTLRRGADPLRRRYLGRRYRYLVDPAAIRKGRPNLALGLYMSGETASSIAAITGVARRHVDGYIAAFEAGRGRDPADYQRGLGADALCQLLGALAPAPGRSA